jgi:GTP-binding protein
MPLPVVAIVGAPNAGKSTLFNRLIGRRQAIVSETPGVTRDRITGEADFLGSRLILVDTGGVVPGEADDLTRRVREEALKAVDEADLVLYVVDARVGITAIDLEVAGLLRASGRPILAVANKIDAASLEGLEFDLYRLGLGDVIPLSAEQGRGIDDVVDQVLQALPVQAVPEQPKGVPIAILGRPNVGKSSLFNRIVREERSLVFPSPGTTRDPVDATFTHGETCYRIIDTAGIRRKARTGGAIEWFSVVKARQALHQAEIVIILFDATQEVGHQDMTLVGLVEGRCAPAVLAVNKIDLLADLGRTLKGRVDHVRDTLRSARHMPIVSISARTGRGVEDLLDSVEALRLQIHRQFATADLNRALREILREKQPPSDRGRDVRLYYMTQGGTAPPRFIIFGNGGRVRPAYRRFMISRLRTHLGLSASPIAMSIRARSASR